VSDVEFALYICTLYLYASNTRHHMDLAAFYAKAYRCDMTNA